VPAAEVVEAILHRSLLGREFRRSSLTAPPSWMTATGRHAEG
jgi:hypothetical protein